MKELFKDYIQDKKINLLSLSIYTQEDILFTINNEYEVILYDNFILVSKEECDLIINYDKIIYIRLNRYPKEEKQQEGENKEGFDPFKLD